MTTTGNSAKNNLAANSHQPVLLSEVIDGLSVKREGIYVDATFGRGGHSQAILGHLGNAGKLIVLDRDPQAIAVAQDRYGNDDRVLIRQASFADLATQLSALNIQSVDGILMDIGVSSPQIDNPERGFSFMHDGPLDMRMDPGHGVPVSKWLQTHTAEEIADVLWRYGEERASRKIAQAIVEQNAIEPLASTRQLAELVESTVGQGSRKAGKHPATRTFQALRIAINDELGQLQTGLRHALNALAVGGRLAVISFHSLEDRIVKQLFRKLATPPAGNRRMPQINSVDLQFKLVGKYLPTREESRDNPRSRSSVLRIIERLQPGEVSA